MTRLLPTGGACLLLALLAFTGRSWSDGKPQPQAPRTRVALVNFPYVLKNYEKWKKLTEDLRGKMAPLETRSRELQAEINRLQNAVNAPGLPADKREPLEAELRQLKRAKEDVHVEATALARKEQDTLTVEMYTEVRQAAERYARAHGIDLVLQYSDAAPDNPAEMNQPANITRKLQQPACLPLYAGPGLDISRELIAVLNASPRRPGNSR